MPHNVSTNCNLAMSCISVLFSFCMEIETSSVCFSARSRHKMKCFTCISLVTEDITKMLIVILFFALSKESKRKKFEDSLKCTQDYVYAAINENAYKKCTFCPSVHESSLCISLANSLNVFSRSRFSHQNFLLGTVGSLWLESVSPFLYCIPIAFNKIL